MKNLNLNTIITKLKSSFEPEDNSFLPSKLGIIFILLLGMTAALLQRESKSEDEPQENLSEESTGPIDALIPESEGLYPIEITNYESLDQVIGQFGVVDLYTSPLDPRQKSRLVVSAVKVVRAAKSPRHFNVLVPADKATKLAGHHNEFTAFVRNPKVLGTEFVKAKAQAPKRRVVYESEVP